MRRAPGTWLLPLALLLGCGGTTARSNGTPSPSDAPDDQVTPPSQPSANGGVPGKPADAGHGGAAIDMPSEGGAAPLEPLEPPDKGAPVNFVGARFEGYDFVEIAGEPDGNPCSGAIVGDLDGDGYDDFVVGGSPDAPQVHELGVRGSAYLFYGAETWPSKLLSAAADLILRGGSNAARLGDVDGDGRDDAGIVASCNCSDFGNDAYCACDETNGLQLLFGREQRYQGAVRVDQVGVSLPGLARDVSGNGDVNGDGYPDLLVGYQDVRLLLGGPALRTGGLSLEDAVAYFEAGSWPAAWIPGDLDADGYDEVIVGGDFASLFYGGESKLVGTLDESKVDARFNASSNPYAAKPIGDLDRDGYDDFVLPGTGAALFFYGRAARFSGTYSNDWSDFTLQVPSSMLEAFGAGDFDADGVIDFLLGDPKDASQGSQAGALFFVPGWQQRQQRNYFVGYEQVVMYGTHHRNLGACISSGGDVNGDGFEDFLVGSPDSSGPEDGRIYLVFGRELTPP